jgi:hypothetical protein
MKKHLNFFMAIILIASFNSISQIPDFETYRRQQEQGFRQFAAERDSIMKAMNKDFEQFVEQRNREYADYLKNEWERMQIFTGAKPDPGPKPDEMPTFDPVKDKKEEKKEITSTIPPAAAQVKPREQFTEPISIKPVDPAAPSLPKTNIDFYGRELQISVDRSFRGIRPGGVQEREVSEWFNNVARTNFAPTLKELLDIADQTGMNDWALFMAAQKLGERLSNNNALGTKLYTWFILLQAGYDIRLGRQEQQLVHLMPFSHIVYNTPRLTIDNKTFYLIGGKSGEPIYTYKQTMPGAFRFFDMNFYKSPTFAVKGKDKTISFDHGGMNIRIDLQYDPVLVAMLASQPQSDMNVYLNADASNYLIRACEKALEPLLQKMDDVARVSFLLKLAQTAFEYQTDIDQFGYQKYMVPDEVIHYKFSDCDDRAVLFGWLVRNYAGQKVAALLYPGHLANAVHFQNGNPPGDYVTIDGRQFVVADPTYINAPIGLSMPEFFNVAPTAWVIDSQRYIFEQNLAAWSTLYDFGARRGNNQRDIAFTKNGGTFVTGYFEDILRRPDNRIRLENYGDKRTAFVGHFNQSMQPQWLHAFDSDNDATGVSILISPQQNVIVAGTFSGNLRIQGRQITSQKDQNDAFVAAFSPNGQLLWLQNAGLDNRHNNNAMAYSLHVTLNGQVKQVHYYNDPRESASGLFADGETGVVFTGTFGNTSGLTMDDAPESASGASMNFSDMLIQKNRELISQRNVESSIAGLIAAIHISKSEGVVFPGSAAQEALRKANPGFPRNFPETFENIGKISFLKNKSGIIEIRTDNGRDVFFDKLRIRNGSTVRLRALPNGDEQIDILSNIHVGQMVVWYPLNFIRLNHRTGDLLFDYRSNNSQVTLNLKRDILN